MSTDNVPWIRVLAEGVVIVGSILLAFGIDAWWDGLQDQRLELEFLQVLEQDLLDNQRELARVGFLHEASAARSAFLAGSSAELASLTQDSLDVLRAGLGSGVAFTAFTGNLDRADLSIVTNSDLRAKLANWSSHAADLVDNTDRDMEALRGVALRAGAGTLGLLGNSPAPGGGAKSLATLRSDDEFLALLDWHAALRAITVREATTLDSLTADVLVKVRSEIGRRR